MPIPDFVVELRKHVGHGELWLPGVTAVVVRDGQVLLVQRADTQAWAPVTGILEPGEEPAAGAAREVLEETGVEVRVERLVSTGVTPRVQHVNGDVASYLDLTFACSWLAGEPYVADDESVAVRWCPTAELPPMKAELRSRIALALDGEAATRFRR